MFQNPLFTPPPESSRKADHRPGHDPDEDTLAYTFRDERLVAAVNVALATRRPLLLTGAPGSGKSTLARTVARHKRWTYVSKGMTSRTELSDLTAGFDAVRRLADAQVNRLLPAWAYV